MRHSFDVAGGTCEACFVKIGEIVIEESGSAYYNNEKGKHQM